AQRDAHAAFVLAGIGDPAGQRVDHRAGRLLRAHALPPVRAAQHDVRHAGDRADVVDDGRARVQAGDRGERWAQPGLATEALERVQQRGFLAADVGAGAAVYHHVQVEPGVQDVRAEV